MHAGGEWADLRLRSGLGAWPRAARPGPTGPLVPVRPHAHTPIGAMQSPTIDPWACHRPQGLAGVALTPLEPSHAPALAGLAEERIFRYLSDLPNSWDTAGMQAWIGRRLAGNNCQFFVVEAGALKRPVGLTAMLGIDRRYRSFEIGWTWFGREFQRRGFNQAAKLSLLTYGFERLSCVRVQFTADTRNHASLRSLIGIGAQVEGRIRNSGIMSDGYVRDSYLLSILDREWPTTKALLLQRIQTEGRS
jgi:N-acetyltransferase